MRRRAAPPARRCCGPAPTSTACYCRRRTLGSPASAPPRSPWRPSPRELRELGAIRQATLDRCRQKRKEGKGPAAKKVVLEVLSQTIDTGGRHTSWRDELGWLFDLRDIPVHYEGAFAPSEPHPLGMSVAPEQVAYLAENVTRAVDLLLAILEWCRDRPKPAARKWSQGMRGAINNLI